ncbi:MAG TPA: S-layer homology domain-containing protein [Candidatus Bathyarchaeia archaeon]|nr:S-layer homology domain-containing protein [Candidatus Bathyarchaeia archaeon]
MRIKKLMLASMTALLMMGMPVVQAEEGSTLQQTEQKEPSTPSTFTDVQGHWAQKEIEQLYVNGAIQPNETGLYRPDDAVTRAELITLFLAAKGIQSLPDNSVQFADVPNDSWLAPIAKTAYRLGYFHGTELNGQLYFKPDEPVQRQELISILLQAKGDSGRVNQLLWSTTIKALQPYADGQEVAQWNQRGMVYALQNNIASAYSDGTLQPTKLMTRAEAAVYAYHQLLDEQKGTLPRLAKLTTPYKKTMSVETTAYVENHVKAYLGWPLRQGIVAVDPNVIPLGTHMYIEGYGYAVAADIGGAVKNQHIDVFLPSLQAAIAYGRQKDTKVYILD